MECSIQVLEQPARRVKFRMEVHSHRCQQKELLLGRNASDEVVLFPTVQIRPNTQNSRLRDGTLVRLSLVDVRSTPDNIIEHWHRLVDCKQDALVTKWSITKQMDGNGLVTFGNLGIVRTLEKEKVPEVTERIIQRRSEQGINVRGNRWERTQIENIAEQQCKETSAYRVKLCLEAFLKTDQGGIVKVAETTFSEDVTDLTNMNSGELAIKKISICSDHAEGGSEVMMFTGGDSGVNKISFTKSTFHVNFFQINPYDETRVWNNRVTIRDCQLHGVGQHLGGIFFNVPPYDRNEKGKPALIQQPTENVFLELIKTSKNNATVQAKSDPISFIYKPSKISRIATKRPLDPSHIEKVLGKTVKVEPFVPTFNLQDTSTYIPVVENPNIPQTVHPIITTTPSIHTGSEELFQENPFSPSSAMGNMMINSPVHSPNFLHGHTSPHHRVSPVPSPIMAPTPQVTQPFPHIDAQVGVGATDLNLIEITNYDIIGSVDIKNIDIEQYLQDGNGACTIASDGTTPTALSPKEAINQKNAKKQDEATNQKEALIKTMCSLKI